MKTLYNKSEGIAKDPGAANVSRRDFLRRMSLLGVGIAAQVPLAAAAQAPNQPTPSHTQANRALPARPKAKTRKVAVFPMSVVEAHIHVNQVGYLPHEAKRAVIPAAAPIPGNGFCILDDSPMPKVRFQGELRPYTTPPGMQYGHFPHHFLADFDAFNRPGRYRVRLSNGVLSSPFSIGKDLYNGLIPLTLNYFGMQRCGVGCTDWHADCHPDDGVILGGPRNGQPIDASGGWHDAGDYLKFVETTSYVTALFLFTCDQFPHVMQDRSLSGALPPLLAQARVGLEWLLKMHPAPNELYFQVGDESDHEVWRLPEQDCTAANLAWKPRQVYYGVGANLAGRMAAAFALASRLYARHDQTFAHRCYEAAQTVYQLGLDNPVVLSTLPHDFYPETTWEDDMAWGAIELFRATHKRTYLQEAIDFAHRAGAAHEETSVYNTHALAHFTLYPYVKGEDREKLREYLRADADIARLRADNPYGLATPYIWGTAEAAAGAAINCLLYARVIEYGGKEIYTQVARQQRDFILGCNPFSQSYVIGAGTHYPLFPHHQVADLQRTELTGALVGGPTTPAIFRAQHIDMNPIEEMTAMKVPPTPSQPDDLMDEMAVYHDSVHDFVTNEPAIDYTAKFLLLAAFYSRREEG